MKWSVNIQLKSGRYIQMDSLIYINISSAMSDSTLAEFENFYLSPNDLLTFVGDNQVVSLSSNEIESVEMLKS